MSIGASSHRRAAALIADHAVPVFSAGDYDRLIERAAEAQCVLIGEASHGTHEFYSTRAALTRRLIEEQGFTLLALEADWPDMLRVNRYVTGRSADLGPAQALGDFRRFPAWMWRNTVMVDFIEWLRSWNGQSERKDRQTGIFGMDLYSMHTSIAAVLEYLRRADPEAARRACRRYGCFDRFGEDPQAYGYATTRGHAESCEPAVVAQLIELRRNYGELLGRDGQLAEDDYFYAEQNARLIKNAEHYYRAMFLGHEESWNLRDEHMVETLAALMGHFASRGNKAIVWAHNSHLGDARATEMNRRGEWNVGQLTRERLPGPIFGIGFSTYCGVVTAARDWGEPAERRQVQPGLAGSYEDLFHASGRPRFWLDLHGNDDAVQMLLEPRLQRAIGVIYRPETERQSHYFESCLPRQFDALIHLDETTALEPLERDSEWDRDELPETYPEGF